MFDSISQFANTHILVVIGITIGAILLAIFAKSWKHRVQLPVRRTRQAEQHLDPVEHPTEITDATIKTSAGVTGTERLMRITEDQAVGRWVDDPAETSEQRPLMWALIVIAAIGSILLAIWLLNRPTDSTEEPADKEKATFKQTFDDVMKVAKKAGRGSGREGDNKAIKVYPEDVDISKFEERTKTALKLENIKVTAVTLCSNNEKWITGIALDFEGNKKGEKPFTSSYEFFNLSNNKGKSLKIMKDLKSKLQLRAVHQRISLEGLDEDQSSGEKVPLDLEVK